MTTHGTKPAHQQREPHGGPVRKTAGRSTHISPSRALNQTIAWGRGASTRAAKTTAKATTAKPTTVPTRSADPSSAGVTYAIVTSVAQP